MSRIVPRPQRAGPDLSLTPRPLPFGFTVVATLGVTGAVEAKPEWRCDASRVLCLPVCGAVCRRPLRLPPRLLSGPWLGDEECGQRKPRLQAPLRRENSSHIPLF